MRLIDADRLCNGICDWQYGSFSKEGCETEITILKSVIDRILRQPTIDAVPVVHGHWIKVDKHTVKCSKCGNYLDKRDVNAGRGDALYCPNCGAKMDEEEDYATND